jgi:glycosyltransferase involved in cell wall biosynthesis
MKNIKASDFFVFGFFGYQTNQLDGQTVKTRLIHELFEEKLSGKISFYDTEKFRKNKLSIINAIILLIRYKNVVYLPAYKNIKEFFPLLFFLSKIFHFKIHYFVVGGWLPNFIAKHPFHTKKLKNISGIFVETEKMLSSLKEKGFPNVYWFPNFRHPLETSTNKHFKSNVKLKMVFMSRINKLKGIDEIFRFLDWAKQEEQLYDEISIDFYGPIDNADKDYFYENVKKNLNTSYQGIINPEDVQKTLSQYDLLLFLTRYPGEGCPGAVIDASMAGLTTIATDWRYNKEFVKDGETGFIIPIEDGLESFIERIKLLKNDPVLLNTLKENAFVFSRKFHPYNAWEIIQKQLSN